jgi:hypothetical protein
MADHLISNRKDLESSFNRRTAGEGIAMTRKSAIYALAVAILMGTMAVSAWADNSGMSEYYAPDRADSSVSAQPEQGYDQSSAGEIRGPVETGALPDGSVKIDSQGELNMDVTEQNSSPELRGLPNIQAGE